MITITSSLPENPITYASIDFTETDEPRSTDFDDVYFSDCGGMDETEHVFINGCDLKKRLPASAGSLSGNGTGPREYLIGETGFGTGLNLLTLMRFYRLLEEEAETLPDITFLTVEKYPLSPDDMARAHRHFPQLEKESKELLQALFSRPLHTGLNRVVINSHFTLVLMIGDISDCYSRISVNQPVNSWFLDGFNPKSNSDMWSLQSMKLLVNLSTAGTNIATFTVCREVRDNLIEAGFTLVKRRGFGRKREMLTGFLASE